MKTADLLHISEAANAFGVSQDTLRRRLDTGAVPEARLGPNGWALPAEALSAIAEREGWPLDLTGNRLTLDEIPNQLDRYISETLAAHAAVVLAKTQAAAARAEARELALRLQEASERLQHEREARESSDEALLDAEEEVRQLSMEREIALARLEEIRGELDYERSRSAHLHKQVNQLYGEHNELIASLGWFGRRRLRAS